MTINEALETVKAVKGRLGELSSLRSECSSRTVYYGQGERVVEPQYDVKAVDRKIVELRNWLLKAESTIKQANATTEITLDVDVDALLAPLD